MKKLYVFVWLMVMFAVTDTQATALPVQEVPGEQLEVFCSPDLHPLMQASLDLYRERNPGIRCNLLALRDGQLASSIAGSEQVAFVTKYYLEGIDPGSIDVRVIGREVYVPVMNPGNPCREEILKNGVSASEFAALYTGNGGKEWNSILENGSKAEARPYRIQDPSFMSYLSGFTGKATEVIGGSVLKTCDDVVQAVKADPQAIGFCTLSQLARMERNMNLDELLIIPVDLNDNNRVDHFEMIYENTTDLQRGIWIGKYSSNLYSRIFAVTASGEMAEDVSGLLTWMVGDGQEILADNGYSPLLEKEREALIAGIEEGSGRQDVKEREDQSDRAVFVVIAFFLGGGLLLFLVLAVFNDRKKDSQSEKVVVPPEFVNESTDVPGGYYFDRSHTWTFLERDGNIRIGLDNFVQRLTGKITRIEMKKPGEWIRKGQPVMSIIQSGKRLEIKSPVTGKIREHNMDLTRKPGLINTAPFSDGWVYMVEPSDWAEEFSTYITGNKYREWIKNEVARLKDFLTSISDPSTEKVIVMQDGGEPEEGILGKMGPEVWEDFQSDFLKY